MDGKSLDLVADKLAKLRTIFPEVFSEELLDIEKLQQVVGQKVTNGNERYSLGWAGKGDAFRVLQEPTTATLVPARDESINFDETGHIFIEGENLEVLKVLQKAYYGKVKMIYIDPPYNTGSDSFIYPDRFAETKEEYLKRIADKDETGLLLKEGLFRKNSKENGQYHSNWLSMMYPRLYLARNLLSEDGVIFVSIDDNEVHNLRLLMNEVFGEENRIECFVWKKSYGGGSKERYAVTQHEYILMYARSIDSIDDLWLPPDKEAEEKYYKYSDEKKAARGPYRLKPLEATKSMDKREKLIFPIPGPEGDIWPKRQWWWSKERVLKSLQNNEIVFTKNGDGYSVSYKQYLRDENGNQRGTKPFSVIDGPYTQTGTADLAKWFDGQSIMQFPKPVDLIKKLISMADSESNDGIILDFFAGSCTTANAVLDINSEDGGNRRFICVQLPEKTGEDTVAFQAGYKTIADIGKERIRKVIAEQEQKATQNNLFSSESTPDLGVKVFTLCGSNFKTWRGDLAETEAELAEQLDMFVDTLRPEAQEEYVAYELTLKSGFELTTSLKRQAQGEANYWSINDGEVLLLLSSLNEELIDAVIAARPQKVICLDSLFHGDDQLKTNTALAMKDAGIPFEVV